MAKCKVVDKKVIANVPRNQRTVATVAVSPGDELIREKPLINLDIGLQYLYDETAFYGHGLTNGRTAVLNATRQLGKDARIAFNKLHNVQPPPNDAQNDNDIGIVLTNAFSEEEDRDFNTYYRTIVYDFISRINHSCAPNAELHWNRNTGFGVVRAIDRIAVNEEVFIDYLGCRDSLASAPLRTQELQQRYRFACNCRVCHLPQLEQTNNDALRTAARTRFNVSFPLPNTPAPVAATVRHATDYVRDLRNLGIRDGRLAAGYGILHDLQVQQGEDSLRRNAAAGNHCTACLSPFGRQGAHWHFEAAKAALDESFKIDKMTHTDDHPVMIKAHTALDTITDKINRCL